MTKRWDDVTIIFIDIGSTTIELIGRDTAPAADSPAGAINHIALHVDDVDTAYQELVAKGVKNQERACQLQGGSHLLLL